MSQVNVSFDAPPDFVYDSQRPTYYTELFSWSLHKHQAALSAAGAKVHIEDKSHEEQAASVSAFSALVENWAASSASALASFLTGQDDAQVPALPDFPDIPDTLLNAVSLLPGGKLALLIKGVVPFVRGFLMLKEKLRPSDPVRLLDKALLKDSWWLPGYRKSWLEAIQERLASIDDKLSKDSETGGALSAALFQEIEVEGSQVEFSLIRILFDLQACFQTIDCAGDVRGLAEILRAALSRCVAAGGDAFDVQTIQDSLDTLTAALSACSVEIETEKAARVRLSGVDAQEQIQFPG